MFFTQVYIAGLVAILGLSSIALHFSFQKYKQAHKERQRGLARAWLVELLSGLGGDLVGTFITTLVFGLLVTVAQSSQQEQFEKNRLIIQMGSDKPTVVLAAAEDLLANGWLRDGTLRNGNYVGANFQGLFLKLADFQGASLNWINGQGVSFIGANLSGSNLFAADLCGAVLMSADLHDARVTSADLRLADFFEARLSGTDFTQSDLRNANFTYAYFDDTTILPDGTSIDTSRPIEEQLKPFTDPTNPDFMGFFDPSDPEKANPSPDCVRFRPTDLPR